MDIKENIDDWASAWHGNEDGFEKIDKRYRKGILTGIKKLERLIENYENHC